MKASLVWFRDDLRVADNPALLAAVGDGAAADAGHDALTEFLDGRVADYSEARDRPDRDGTSYITTRTSPPPTCGTPASCTTACAWWPPASWSRTPGCTGAWGSSGSGTRWWMPASATNPANWQWAAGSGADASPFLRIFNPETQAKKFDPEGKYVSRWVPELLTPYYPEPLVDLQESRRAALDTYSSIK